MAKPPARSVTDLPSFMSTRAEPLTIIRCSLGVCQCQGNVHPVEALATMMDAPLDGSPLCTAPVEQVGIPGNSPNFMSAMLAAVIVGAASSPRLEGAAAASAMATKRA